MSTYSQRTLLALIAMLPLLGVGENRALAKQPPVASQPSAEELLKQIKVLEQRLRTQKSSRHLKTASMVAYTVRTPLRNGLLAAGTFRHSK